MNIQLMDTGFAGRFHLLLDNAAIDMLLYPDLYFQFSTSLGTSLFLFCFLAMLIEAVKNGLQGVYHKVETIYYSPSEEIQEHTFGLFQLRVKLKLFSSEYKARLQAAPRL